MRLPVHHNHNVVVGNPFLAALVHMNIWFSIPILLVVAWYHYAHRIDVYNDKMNDWSRSWYGSMVGIMTLTELPRLYFGYVGNISQSVAHLFGFVSLTFVTHFALMLAYLLLTPYRNSLDFAVAIIALIFGFFEAIFGAITLKSLLWRNTVNFYLQLGTEITTTSAEPAPSGSTRLSG
jgi:hypothetical protein